MGAGWLAGALSSLRHRARSYFNWLGCHLLVSTSLVAGPDGHSHHHPQTLSPPPSVPPTMMRVFYSTTRRTMWSTCPVSTATATPAVTSSPACSLRSITTTLTLTSTGLGQTFTSRMFIMIRSCIILCVASVTAIYLSPGLHCASNVMSILVDQMNLRNTTSNSKLKGKDTKTTFDFPTDYTSTDDETQSCVSDWWSKPHRYPIFIWPITYSFFGLHTISKYAKLYVSIKYLSKSTCVANCGEIYKVNV